MTDAELDALEVAAKAATPGPWLLEELSTRKNGYAIFPAPNGHTLAFVDGADAAFIAAANPAAVLDLIAELRQTKEECLHHKDYIAELEQSSRVYDKRLADISKLLDIEHEDGSYAELSYIYHSVKRLQGELRQARAERNWLVENMPNNVCPEGKTVCADRCPTAGGKACYSCVLCWLQAAKEATCRK